MKKAAPSASSALPRRFVVPKVSRRVLCAFASAKSMTIHELADTTRLKRRSLAQCLRWLVKHDLMQRVQVT